MESVKDILHLSHHRSRKRIRDLGEVFTPDKYVQKMLDMLDKSVWADTNTVFFEPTAGHGNFVEAIVERRLNVFLRKAKRQKIKKPHFYAVANTLNNLWAIDIDSKNIEFCRDRVCSEVFSFLLKNEKISSPIECFIKKNRVFLTHVLCCIEWHIQENEVLSCLEENHTKAEKAASKTIISKKWLKKNKHKPINFNMSWCEYFKCMKKDNTIPFEYTKNYKVLSGFLSNNAKTYKRHNSFKSLVFLFKDYNFLQKSA